MTGRLEELGLTTGALRTAAEHKAGASDYGSDSYMTALEPLLYVLTPLSIVLVGFFVDDLLAPRALGGLLLLLAAPLLDAARWHASPLRLVVVVAAYILVVKGVVLVVCPYQFRKKVERFLTGDHACRLWGSAGCVVGAVLLTLALTVY